MRPRCVAIVAGVVLALGVAAWWAFTVFAPRAFIEIDQAQLQARLDARFPHRNCTLMVACLTLSAPVVTLAEGSNRIGLSADVLVTLGKREMPGKVAFSGVLRYVRYEGDFYLDDVQVDNFSLTGFPPELVQVVKVRPGRHAGQAGGARRAGGRRQDARDVPALRRLSGADKFREYLPDSKLMC